MSDRVRIYQATDGWRWTRRASNGSIVGASTEAYSNREGAESNIESTQAQPFEIVEDTPSVEDPSLHRDGEPEPPPEEDSGTSEWDNAGGR